jgi:hypothetical protein
MAVHCVTNVINRYSNQLECVSLTTASHAETYGGVTNLSGFLCTYKGLKETSRIVRYFRLFDAQVLITELVLHAAS